MNYIRIGGNDDGAKLASGGKRLSRGDYANGHFIEPTVFTDAAPDMRISQEEIFGPVTTVIPTNSLEDAIQIAFFFNDTATTEIYTQNVNRAFRAMTRCTPVSST